jgi:hypothetical protein
LQYYPGICLHAMTRTESTHSRYSASWPYSNWKTRENVIACVKLLGDNHHDIQVFKLSRSKIIYFERLDDSWLRNSTQKMNKTTVAQNYIEQCATCSGFTVSHHPAQIQCVLYISVSSQTYRFTLHIFQPVPGDGSQMILNMFHIRQQT